MKRRLILCATGFAFLIMGCGPITYSIRTLIVEPSQYCTEWNALAERRRDHRLAEAAWKEIAGKRRGSGFSKDYADGFIAGYEDFLFAGGNGAPPPLPPRAYWKARYESPEGRMAIDEWFAGFRHGASEAQQSGYRSLILVPSSALGVGPFGERPNPIISGPPHDFMPASTLFPADGLTEEGLEKLPAPKPALGPPRKVPGANKNPVSGGQKSSSPTP